MVGNRYREGKGLGKGVGRCGKGIDRDEAGKDGKGEGATAHRL